MTYTLISLIINSMYSEKQIRMPVQQKKANILLADI